MSSSRARRISVLVVEDEDDIRDMIISRLRKNGYYAQGADSLTSAFGQINNHQYNLLVFDLRLKGESGVDLIKYVKSNKESKNSKTPIMIVSGNIDQDAVKALKGMIDDAIVKPFSSDEFISKVEGLAGVPEKPEKEDEANVTEDILE